MVNAGATASVRTPLAAALETLYRDALGALQADALVAHALAIAPPPSGPLRLLALGKAAGPMMEAALQALGPRARDPLCLLPEGASAPDSVRAYHGNHPHPGLGSVAAGDALLEWAAAARGEPSLVLLSGGGSALAVAPAEGITFAEKALSIGALMRAGLPIQQLNAVRKHLSRTKGGRLGAALAPAPVRVLVLSDVPGDDLSTVASGPLVADGTRWSDVARIVAESGAERSLPESVRSAIRDGAAGRRDETPKPGDPRLDGVSHELLAGPPALAHAAAEAARRRGIEAEHDPTPLTGSVDEIAGRLALWIWEHAGRGRRLLALAGEPTITIPCGAHGASGGRAQHLALTVARAVAGIPCALLVAGSDGRDGPTTEAGAVVTGETAPFARWNGLDLGAELAEFRSGPASRLLGAAIPAFQSGTHLGDLVLVAVG